jgi:quercetin dioxygenase-like cupin family protein
MKIFHYEQVDAAPVEMEGAVNCRMRCLIGPDQGAPGFTMRMFEIGPGGHTPSHAHAHEHEVFALEGFGAALEEGVEHPLRPGTAVFVPPNQTHQFRNTGPGLLKFLCLIPHATRGMSAPCAACCDG